MIDHLADLLLGSRCPGCGAPGLAVCPRCRASLPTGAHRLVDVLLPGGAWVVAAGRYDGALRELLNAHKDHAALGLTGLLSGLLVAPVRLVLAQAPPGSRVVLVPVPSSPVAVRRRGFDHAMALARGARRRLPASQRGRVRVRRVLRRRGRVIDQSALGRRQRQRNQAHTMVAAPPRPGEVAMVADDICTSGASLAEAARALRAAGWQVLGAAVVAHPERRW